MLRRIEITESTELTSALPRAELTAEHISDSVTEILSAVQQRGTEAVLELTEKFDRVRPGQLRVPLGALRDAEKQLSDELREALTTMIERTRTAHSAQKREEVTTHPAPGGSVTQRWVPVRRVGLYVPGGLAAYPSSVVMNVVPAQIAGVVSIGLVSPPQRDTGLPHPLVLAAASLLGVDEVYAVGGAQAVGMLAYGVDGCEAVDLITGPGNIWVTTAKRLVRGVVGIDAEAGPTEIAILADDTADPVHVAADLISQAEHDPKAASVLITPSRALMDAVDAELGKRVPATKHAERVHTALTSRQSGAVLVRDLAEGVRVADAYAAEHLEIHTVDARQVAYRIRNAGAVFIGAYSPVSLGDYCAGSNHVLPTSGCARHTGGLSVQAFLRGVQLVEYNEEALRSITQHIIALADAENLPAHGEAIEARWGCTTGRGQSIESGAEELNGDDTTSREAAR